MAIELNEFDIEFKPRVSAKSQVLADFIVELPAGQTPMDPMTAEWVLRVDGSSSRHGSGIGIRLESPIGEVLEQSFRLEFKASNNEAEYEALLAGLRLACELAAVRIHALCGSQLVASQFSDEYEARDERMDSYLKLVRDLATNFESLQITKIPCSENIAADALAALGSSLDTDRRHTIPVETIAEPSIELARGVCHVYEINDESPPEHEDDEAMISKTGTDWRDEVREYLASGKVPEDKWAAR